MTSTCRDASGSIRAIEFYSGIGGLHLALRGSSVRASVTCAFDWDQAACEVYKANHGKDIVYQRDILSLSAQELSDIRADAWLLSPSCQPYTVLNPLAKGAEDPRAKSFIHLVEHVLPALVLTDTEPRYLLVENVAGFETSSTRQGVLHTLHSLNYTTAEFLLTPLQFGIPNSRLRYYLLAKKKPARFRDNVEGTVCRHIPGIEDDWVDPRTIKGPDTEASVEPIQSYIDYDAPFEDYKIPDRVLEKWGRLFDIVTPSTRRTCCFTRGYTKLAERAGSILQMNEELDTSTVFDSFLSAQKSGDPDAVRILDPLRLRYFSPDELLRLFSFLRTPAESSPTKFPVSFVWPAGVSNKTRYKLIGNSVNVTVVSKLIDYLFQ